MSQRNSGYQRIEGDTYVTPKRVWELLYSVEPWAKYAFDCAPINRNGYDFLDDWDVYGGIATNPPYGKLAERFVRHALDLPDCPPVAMLLPHAWDTAKTRTELFRCQRFKAKYAITERIKWDNFTHTASPSSNHAWYVWRSEPRGFIKPAMGWLP